MPLLTEAAYHATMRPPMQQLPKEAGLAVDFWEYVDSIPEADSAGYDFSAGRVDYVWHSSDGHFEHVLINADESGDVFLVIVIDLGLLKVVGHHLLNLPVIYGLEGAE